MSKPKRRSLKAASESKVRSYNPDADQLKEKAASEPKKQIHAYIPQSLHTQFKVKAAEEGRKMSKVLEEMIARYVSN